MSTKPSESLDFMATSAPCRGDHALPWSPRIPWVSGTSRVFDVVVTVVTAQHARMTWKSGMTWQVVAV